MSKRNKNNFRIYLNEKGNVVVEVDTPKSRFGALHTIQQATTQDSRAEMLRKNRRREKQRGWDD